MNEQIDKAIWPIVKEAEVIHDGLKALHVQVNAINKKGKIINKKIEALIHGLNEDVEEVNKNTK